MARLAVRHETLVRLAHRSSNRCAFPGCTHAILDNAGTYIAQLCHIEAAEAGGPRYNPTQTDEDRRSYDNLLFLCHEHHKVTDDVAVYTVFRMREMKRGHEEKTVPIQNSEGIAAAVERVESGLANLNAQFARFAAQESPKPNKGYPIKTPGSTEAWIPEEGKKYVYPLENGGKFRVMMRGGLACIEHLMVDGAIAYYELDEKGDMKNSKWPYPVSEYTLIIPPEMIIGQTSRTSPTGYVETIYILKWQRRVRVVRDKEGKLQAIESNARHKASHPLRRIEVLNQ